MLPRAEGPRSKLIEPNRDWWVPKGLKSTQHAVDMEAWPLGKCSRINNDVFLTILPPFKHQHWPVFISLHPRLACITENTSIHVLYSFQACTSHLLHELDLQLPLNWRFPPFPICFNPRLSVLAWGSSLLSKCIVIHLRMFPKHASMSTTFWAPSRPQNCQSPSISIIIHPHPSGLGPTASALLKNTFGWL